jgi:hypothetical protein
MFLLEKSLVNIEVRLGMRSRENIMMSTVLTLKKRQKNPFSFVQNKIEKYNLGSGPPIVGVVNIS